MQPWLDYLEYIWHQNWVAWAVFAGYLALTWFLAGLTRRVLKGVVGNLTRRSDTTLDDRLVEAAAGPLRRMVLVAGLSFAVGSLENKIAAFSTGGNLANEFEMVQKGIIALVVLAVASLLNGLFRAALDWYMYEKADLREDAADKELIPVLRLAASVIIYFVATTIILDRFDQDITALVTTAGVASLAVALAAQETLSNMISGFTILVDRPFKVGDWIELGDGTVGEVIEIGLRSTRIQKFDGNALVVPNKEIANTQVINYAQPRPQAAIRQTIGVDYGTDIEKAKQVLLSVLESHPKVLKDPAPGVWFTGFGDSALNLFMSCWVASYRDRFTTTDELNMAILKAFRENGINIPFPQRDVHLFVQQGNLSQLPKE